MLCARECPDWCIYIDSHKETLPAPEGGRPRQRNVLDRFAIDFALCMYCGICIEVCPFDALFWSPEFEYAEGDIRNLLHEKDKLGTWVETVPPPQLHDAGAEPPKELSAAPRRPARATDAPSARTPRAPGKAAAPGTNAAPSEAPTTDTDAASVRPEQAPPPGEVTPSDTSTPPRPATAEPDPKADEPPMPRPGDAASSTGAPSGEELSTGAEEPRAEPGPEGQTSGARPPRRRMADPRSIRPPGRLGPDQPREPKEES
ncbi:4Fe-4S binding protein [Nonomuraea sp. ZG12]|uniref:4Fe-4S binding protein n=1 Tax=Nonomuraea sp. ZG12 TaxID=3452207 RepID=UPI003F8950A1